MFTRFSIGFIFKCFILVLLFSGCKKEEKSNININIISPVNGITYYFGDTVLVKAEIFSLQTIQLVELNLKSSSGNPVTPSVNAAPNSKTYSLTVLYPLHAEGIDAGTYFLDITVFDGIRRIHNSIQLNMLNYPLRTRAVYFIEQSVPSLRINRLDSTGLNFFTSIPGDFSGAGILQSQHLLITSGYQSGGINWMDLAQNGAVIHTIPPYNVASGPSYRYGEVFDYLYYVSRFDGSVKGYDYTGNRIFDTGENPYFIPGQLIKSSSNILAEVTYIPSQERKLMAFFYPSGVANLVQPIDFDAQKWISMNADSSLVFGERNGRAYAWYYLVATGFANEVKDLGITGRIYDAVRLASGKIVLAAANGMIEYDPQINSSFLISTQPVTDLEVNELTSEIYCASGHNTFSLDANYQQSNFHLFTDSVVAIKAEYGR